MAKNMSRRTHIVFWLALVGVAAACSDLGAPPSFEMTLTADKTTAAAGTPLVIDYTVTGSFLQGVFLTYGDGSKVDSFLVYTGAQSAYGHVSHTWTDAGDFTVVGTAYNDPGGALSKELLIHVTAPAGAPAGS